MSLFLTQIPQQPKRHKICKSRPARPNNCIGLSLVCFSPKTQTMKNSKFECLLSPRFPKQLNKPRTYRNSLVKKKSQKQWERFCYLSKRNKFELSKVCIFVVPSPNNEEPKIQNPKHSPIPEFSQQLNKEQRIR